MPDVDRHLAGVIEARRKELGLSVQALVELTGITRQGLQPLLRGERRQYQDRLKLPLCAALEWTPDSIDRLLAGDEPVLLSADRPPNGVVHPELISRLDERYVRREIAELGLPELARLGSQLDELTHRFDDTTRRLAALEEESAARKRRATRRRGPRSV